MKRGRYKYEVVVAIADYRDSTVIPEVRNASRQIGAGRGNASLVHHPKPESAAARVLCHS